MKRKNLYIICTIGVLVIAGSALGYYFKSKSSSRHKGKEELITFLEGFGKHVHNRQPDSLYRYFDHPNSKVKTLVAMLTGNTLDDADSLERMSTIINADAAVIRTLNPILTEATVPVQFSHDSLPDKKSTLTFTIQKKDKQPYKIIAVKGEQLYKDYMTYANDIHWRYARPVTHYDALTLKAFTTAEKLKTRYDSVVWFAHLNDKTYFYVTKGKWEEYIAMNPDSVKLYGMGMVNPALQEIIPPKYDLIHNISGTFDGLVEVEKGPYKGFYDLNGKLVVPVTYNEILPLKQGAHLAALRKGDEYFWLDAGYTVSPKIEDFKITEVLPQVQLYQASYHLSNAPGKLIMEYNSRDNNASIYVPPSHLVNWQMFEAIQAFKNPLRKANYMDDISAPSVSYQVKYTKDEQSSNWLQTLYYSIKNHYLGGRSDFYEKRNVLIVDKRHNQAYGYSLNGGYEEDSYPEGCENYSLKILNDSLFEIKSCGSTYAAIDEQHSLLTMPLYYYLTVKNGKLIELRSKRQFAFTQFVKIDDRYLQGDYTYNEKKLSKLPDAMLEYIKNEIYAGYDYKFSNDKWSHAFELMHSDNNGKYAGNNTSVQDSLTEIDKYNINWLQQKINSRKQQQMAAVSK